MSAVEPESQDTTAGSSEASAGEALPAEPQHSEKMHGLGLYARARNRSSSGYFVEKPSPDLPAVEVQEVFIKFRSYERRPTTFKESMLTLLKERRIKHYRTFEALKGVSFSVPRGGVFGIIGANGAGKSTMLRTITGVLPPSKGRVIVRGRIDSLIQLGAGFDYELNAIENIYLNRSLYGFSRSEIKKRIPGIIEFAELQEFSTTPIKYYSSGMAARLGFAVAIDRDPDILVVDEVLAVGDERFTNKCMAVIQKLLKRGKTIIIVSHNLEQIRELADQVALLSKGRLVYLGDATEAIDRYRDESYQSLSP